MKWAAFVACAALMMPLVVWLRANPPGRLYFWMLLGFLPFVIDHFHLYLAIDSKPDWGGYVKGTEISGLDFVALALYLSLPSSRYRLPFRLSMAFYLVAVVFSAIQAPEPIESLFYAWQLARMFLIYATVARGCADLGTTWAVMKGMGAALMMEAIFVIWQRFGLHLIQTPGTLVHQNLLGLMSHMVIIPFFALFLAGRRGPIPPAVLLAGVITDISTASRGTIGLAAVGCLLIFALSAAGRWSSRKARILLVSTLAAAIILPAVASSFAERFDRVPLDDNYDEREAYKEAAGKMLSDHPLGVGANSFAIAGNLGGYYDRAGVAATELSRAGNVHNIYYLVAAETGYLGIISFAIFLIGPLVVAFRCGWRNLRDDRGVVLLGFGVALFTVYCHSWVEWSLATFSAEYLLAITIGLVASNASALGYWFPANRRAVMPGSLIAQANLPIANRETNMAPLRKA